MDALQSSLLRQPSLVRKRLSFISASARPMTVSCLTREKDPKKRVVITGMGLVSVFGNDVDTFHDKLLEGESGVAKIDRFDTTQFSSKFAAQIREFDSEGYIDGEKDKRLNIDYIQICIVAGKKAMENANLTGDSLRKINKEQAGVIVGTETGGITASTMLANDMGFGGPTYSIWSACATSNSCFCIAADHIRYGKADLMLVGGTEAPIDPIRLEDFEASEFLSQRNDDPKTASRPWDKNRDGFVMGEGAGVLVLESLEHAMKRGAPIIAEYLGGAMNYDADHMINPIADGLLASFCIEKCLKNAGVSPEEINYINAHATSSLTGDLAEIKAIQNAFKNTSEIKVNSTKSMIGHSLSASGALEAIATIKAITTGWLHPTINQFNVEPCIEFDTVANKKQQYEVNVAISNSFGLVGQNCVVAFSTFKP